MGIGLIQECTEDSFGISKMQVSETCKVDFTSHQSVHSGLNFGDAHPTNITGHLVIKVLRISQYKKLVTLNDCNIFGQQHYNKSQKQVFFSAEGV